MKLFRYSYSCPIFPVDQPMTTVLGEVTAPNRSRAYYLARNHVFASHRCAFGIVMLSAGQGTTEREHLDRLAIARGAQSQLALAIDDLVRIPASVQSTVMASILNRRTPQGTSLADWEASDGY